MQRTEILTLLDEQRKYYNDSIDRIQRQFSESLKDHDKRLNDIIASLEFTQSRLDESLVDLTTTARDRETDRNRMRELENENRSLKSQVNDLQNRTDYLDDQSRRNNLRFTGVAEKQGENWEQCQVMISSLLKEKMNIQNVKFERVHRVGKYDANRNRDVIAKFACFPDRDLVFRSRRKLKGTNVYINEDFCSATVEIRREQMGALNEARREGKLAFFNYRTLVVRGGRGWGGDGSRRNPAHPQRSPINSPPPRRPTSPPHQPITPARAPNHINPFILTSTRSSNPPSPFLRTPPASRFTSPPRQSTNALPSLAHLTSLPTRHTSVSSPAPTQPRPEERGATPVMAVNTDAGATVLPQRISTVPGTPRDYRCTSPDQSKTSRPRKQPDRYTS